MEQFNHIRRRDFLVAGAATAGLAAATTSPVSAQRARNPVVTENLHEGTTDWLLQNPRVTPSDPLWHMFGLRCPWIEGYCSQMTVRSGDTLSIYVSTSPAAKYTLDIYRTGYYGGGEPV